MSLNLVEVILIIFAFYGLQNILAIGEPKPIKAIRGFLSRSLYFRKLFKCPLCLGFWVGLLIVAACYWIPPPYKLMVLFPLASSGVCYFFHNLTFFALMDEEGERSDDNVSDSNKGTGQ